ncbi:MAG: ABC transporter substrate-binding protein [Dehalococcoidales bacterium]|nr:ABC transporter substrate-binding protein [Dehalococcoidales bacterium]
MKRNRLLTLLVGLCLTMVLLAIPIMSACVTQEETPTETPGTTPGTTPSQDVKTVKIGMLFSWTGSYAPYGVPLRESAQNAMKLINEGDRYNEATLPDGGFMVNGQKYKIELVGYDGRTDPKRAVAGINYLYEVEGIKMIIGTMTSPEQFACQPISEAAHIIMIGGHAADELTQPGIKYTWATSDSQSNRARATLGYYCKIMKAKRVAMLIENYASMVSLQTGALTVFEEFKKEGVDTQLVANELFESNVTDFSTIIARLKTSDPDIIYLGAHPGVCVLVVKQLYEAGWPVIVTSATELISKDTFVVGGKAANELFGIAGIDYFAFRDGKITKEVADAMGTNVDWYMATAQSYMKDYPESDTRFATSCYTHLNSFVNCMIRSGTADDAVKMRDTYEGMEFMDVSGIRKLTANHRVTSYMPVSVYFESATGADNGKLLAVFTHTDNWQTKWEAIYQAPYDTFPGIRERRGY